jgi:DNA repair protein SbcC/Rad50
MIPKYLKIKGLYSYQEEAEIDFDKLSEAHIFGIFGRVGSGKSSILEAITFALYGEVSRMSSRDGRNYNLMNLRSNQLHIEFIFEAATETYRILVDAERHKKNFEKVEQYKFRHFKKDKENWSPLSNFDPKEVIGLERSHFTKAVIIPQNRFQDFLLMGDADRNTMMKNLFSLEQYDLGDKLKALETENSTSLQIANVQFEPIKEVSKEFIDARQSEYTELQMLQIENEKQLKIHQHNEAKMKDLQKQFERLEVLKNEWGILEKQAPQYEALETQSERYNHCRLNFQNLFDTQRTVSKKLLDTELDLNKNKQQLLDNQAILNDINKEFDIIKIQFDNKEVLKTEYLDLENVLILKKLKADFHEKTESLAKGNTLFNEKKEVIETLKNTKNLLENERQNLRAKQPDYSELNAIKDWFSSLKILEIDAQKHEAEVTNLTEKIEAIEINKRYIWKRDLPFFNIHLENEPTISAVIKLVKKAIETVQNDKAQKQKQYQHDLAMARVEDLAASLSDGEPCPLCGSVHHPSVMNLSNIQESSKALAVQIEKLDNQWKTLHNIEIQLDTQIINFNKLILDRQNKTHEAKEAREKIQKHSTLFIWKKYSPTDENAINILFDSADSLKKQMDSVEDKIADNTKKLDAETATLDKFQKRISELEMLIASTSGQISTIQTQIKMRDIEALLLKPDEDLIKQKESLKNSIENIEKVYAETDAKQRQIAEKVGILRGGIEADEKNFNTLKNEAQAIIQQIENQLVASSQFKDLVEIETLLRLNLDVENEQKRVANFKEKRYAAATNLGVLSAELKDKDYNKDNHDALNLTIFNLNKTIETQKEDCTRAEMTIKNLLLKLEESKKLRAEIKKLDARAANLKTLKTLFAGGGFVEYVSTKYLEQLCRAANERFKSLTQQQLHLEINDKNDFQIKDMLNDGQVRSVRTLSGGQVFQAALSLAIALADSIQPLMKSKQNFFFLDEGFGALDRESLQVVFETLKALRKENRIVGVISHVEDMQQEIERYLKVTLDDVRGSQVKMM